MESCANCGHPRGAGRFCTNCGQPADDWRTGTAERPAVDAGPDPVTPDPETPAPVTPVPVTPPSRAVVPPPAGSVPREGPRFPLFADEATSGPSSAPTPGPVDRTGPSTTDTSVLTPTSAPAPTPPHTPTHTGAHSSPRAHRPWLLWLAAAAVLVLVAVLAGWLLGGGDDTTGDRTTATAGRTTGRDTGGGKGTASPSGSTAPGESTDVARTATAIVPATAPPNQDVSGNMVRYEGRNMLDGVAQTCWRMPGDGTGSEITLQLPGPTTVSSVGLVNGYAKVARDASGRRLDWYHGNRRLLRVEWVFDDGTTVRQSLDDTRRMQSVDVDPVTTQTVRLRLVEVSPPGSGPAARDNTAISDVSLVGAPA